MRKTHIFTAIGLFLSALFCSAYAQERGFLSAPAVNGEALVFASEGDLWRGSTRGGTATRITTHTELETNPAISPDGRMIAFNAHYDGPREVYVMPIAGGSPKRITFEGGGVTVRGWTQDNKVIFASSNEPGTRPRVLRLVDPTTTAVTTIPLLEASNGFYGGGGDNAFYFTRFGLAASSGDNAVLYRGGLMGQLWRFNESAGAEAVRLAEGFGAGIHDIMSWDGRIYFVSDKNGFDNFWSVNADGGDARRHTEFSDWRLKSPSLSGGVIYYQRGADLYAYDIASSAERRIDIRLDSDRDFTRTRWLNKPLDYLDSVHIAPDGKSVVLTARSNVARAFSGKRRRVELAIPDEARVRGAVLGTQSKWIYAIVDQGLNGEIWKFPADGRGEGAQLTKGADAHIWKLSVSPDGKRLIFDDKRARLWSLSLNGASKPVLIETNDTGTDDAYADIAWSKGGRYLAYTTYTATGLGQAIIRDVQTGQRVVVSGDKYDSGAPAFSADGKWLYFVSNRNFRASPSSPWGDRVPGTAFDRRGKIYAVQLVPGSQFPFEPKNELSKSDKTDEDENEKEDKDASKDKGVVLNGLASRLWHVPVDAGNYSNLQATGDYLFVGARAGNSTALKAIKIDPIKPEMKELVGDIRSYELSHDGKTILYIAGDAPTIALIPAKESAPDDMSAHKVRVGDWRLAVNARLEWRQQFLDAWRMHRDFAFDPDLRGVDWGAVREKFLPLVDRIGHRNELNDLLGQMSSELGILHSQVRFGDQPSDEEGAAVGALGAEYELSRDGLRITEIYQGERDLIEQLGPLLKPGVDVRVGDVLTAIDGRAVRSSDDLSTALAHKAGQEVRLDLKRGRADVSAIVKPVSAGGARGLRYRHWVESNRRYVKEAGEDNLGYLHLRAMGGGDVSSFVRDFYQHVDKGGVIIDVRGNGGGSVDSLIIAALMREVWAFWTGPLGGEPFTNMQQTFRGHLVVLINEGTYSDGETFSAGIKALEIAPLIGTRTAGAGIWLSGRNPLSDNGMARVAEYPQFGLDGRWLIEAKGVSPDFEVINPPYASFNGEDAQLNAAIKYLEDKIRTEPIPELTPKPLPPLGQHGQDVR